LSTISILPKFSFLFNTFSLYSPSLFTPHFLPPYDQLKELNRLRAENEKLVRHNNHRQKLQYTEALKKESNQLKIEIIRLKEYVAELESRENKENKPIVTVMTRKSKRIVSGTGGGM